MNDFELRALHNGLGGPGGFMDDVAVEFHGDAIQREGEMGEEGGEGESGGDLDRVTVQRDRNGRGRRSQRTSSVCGLTPPPTAGYSNRLRESGLCDAWLSHVGLLLVMPQTLAEQYFPILIQLMLAFAVAGGMVGAGLLLGRRVKNKVKDLPYECGMTPQGNARERFSVKFYLVAMLFILFDIEAVFLYPWAVVFRELKMVAFVEMILFMVFILTGFFYIWKKGALSWTVEETSKLHKPPHLTTSAPPALGGGWQLTEEPVAAVEEIAKR